MPTEVADYIGQLDQSRPQGSESVGESDDHDRLIKKTITQTFLGDGDTDLWDTALNVGPRYLNDLLNTYTPENWVTLDTGQTITGAKTFTAAIQADLGLNNNDGANLISEAADVTAISNFADTTQILGTDDAAITATWDDGNASAKVLNEANFMRLVLDTIYPVGSVYHSAVPTDPGTHLGGTWTRVAEGRFVAGVGSHTDANEDVFNVVAGDVVEGTYKHTLTEAEMPTHTHGINTHISSSGGLLEITQTGSSNDQVKQTTSTGGSGAHNNIPPGYGLYVWERTA